MNSKAIWILLFSLFVFWVHPIAAQDEVSAPPTIDFKADVFPILEKNCAQCHNDEIAESDFNIHDGDSVLEKIEAGDPHASVLFQTFSGEEVSLMPPEEDDDGNELAPLSNAEKAIVYLWIQQGAKMEKAVAAEEEKEELSVVRRFFLFSGHFHPAIVHFPIALITFSAIFIVLFFRIDALSDDAAYYLLFFGTLSAIAACVVGWAFADPRLNNVTDWSHGINRHRWVAIGATVLAMICTILGWRARNEVLSQRSSVWKFGVVVTAGLIGLVGHQGGEVSYGENFYEKAAEKYIPEYWPFGGDDKNEDDGKQDANKGGQPKQDANQKNNDQKNNNQKPDDGKNPDSKSKNDENNSPDNLKSNDENKSDNPPANNEKKSSDSNESDSKNNDSKSDDSKPPVDPTIDPDGK